MMQLKIALFDNIKPNIIYIWAFHIYLRKILILTIELKEMWSA